MLTAKIEQWDRPPNWLLVDFYNRGSAPGSVFEVAAQANGVTYNRPCCGTDAQSLAVMVSRPSATYLVLLVGVIVALMF